MSKPIVDSKISPAKNLDAPKSDVAIEKVPARVGVVPTSIEEAWRLATMFAKSDLVPKGFRERPHDVMVAIQMGAELRLAPTQALQSIAVINGRPGIYGDGLLAIVMQSPDFVDYDEYFEVGGQRCARATPDDLKVDSTTAVCTFVRRGMTTPKTRTFSVADARKAKLLTKDGPWQEYPARMLQMRARAFAARDTFPDVLRGFRTTDELHDVPADEPPAVPRIVRRISESGAAPAPSVAPPPPLKTAVVESVVVDVDRVARVVQLGDGALVHADPADVPELVKFIGSSTLLRFTLTERSDGDFIESFEVGY
jgi:hypothetical protein